MSKTFVFLGMEYSKRDFVLERKNIDHCNRVVFNIFDWCQGEGIDLKLAILDPTEYEMYISYVRRATPKEIKVYDAAVAQGKEAAKKRKESLIRKDLSTLAKLAAKYGKTIK